MDNGGDSASLTAVREALTPNLGNARNMPAMACFWRVDDAAQADAHRCVSIASPMTRIGLTPCDISSSDRRGK